MALPLGRMEPLIEESTKYQRKSLNDLSSSVTDRLEKVQLTQVAHLFPQPLTVQTKISDGILPEHSQKIRAMLGPHYDLFIEEVNKGKDAKTTLKEMKEMIRQNKVVAMKTD